MRCRSREQADVKLFGYSALSHMYLIRCAQGSPGPPPFNQSLSSARIVGFQLSCSGTITCMKVAARPACGWQRPVELNDKPRLLSKVLTRLFPRLPSLCETATYELSHSRSDTSCSWRWRDCQMATTGGQFAPPHISCAHVISQCTPLLLHTFNH